MRDTYILQGRMHECTQQGRNPTFDGCGFHIYSIVIQFSAFDIVAILLSMDAGFILD
jgi:hypothetical protein